MTAYVASSLRKEEGVDDHRKSLRLGAVMIVGALLLRLCAAGALEPIATWLLRPNVQSFLIYLEIGRIIRFSPSSREDLDFAGESAAPVLSGQPLSFPADAGENIQIKNTSGKNVDLSSLLSQPLDWDLTTDAVLIIHTHTTESYTRAPGEDYEESGDFRTLDESYNMLSVGDALAALLEAGGIRVIHDRGIYDYPSYNGSYALAREAIQSHLREDPGISLVLDLHRDAAGDINNQMKTAISLNGTECARLMLVMGTDGSGGSHPLWQENLAVGVKLQYLMEKIAPGLTRPISLRGQRFNQDLSTGALLVEVGAAGDSHDAALEAMSVLAQAILELRYGSK